MNYYIYYRSALPAAELQQRLRAMQRELRERTQVEGRFFQQAVDPCVWMEVYEDVPAAFETELERLVAAHGLDTVLAPNEKRHLEKFLPR